MANSSEESEVAVLRSVALQNAQSILVARQRAEQDLIMANQALERKTEELANSLSQMRATLESTTDGILVTDGAGNITDWNEKYLQMWQLSREMVEQVNHRHLVVDIAKAFRNIDAHSSRLDEIYSSSPRETFDLIELSDGRVFERFSKIQNVNDRNVGRVWSYRDITDRRRTEEALGDEREVLEILNRTGTAMASTLDLQTLIQVVTDAAAKLSEAELGAFFYSAAKSANGVYHLYASAGVPNDDIQKISGPLIAPLFGSNSKGRETVRCDDVRKDTRFSEMSNLQNTSNEPIPVRSYMAVPLILRSGEIIGGLFLTHAEAGKFDERIERIIVGVASQASVAIDNARLFEAAQQSALERETLLESERRARAMAERMGELKDEFLANLSHELRTPLSAIVGWSKVLRLGVKDEADLHNGLDTIERNARMQKQLIDDLLDMNRIASGKVRLDIQPIAPISFIEAAIDTVRPAAEAKGIRIEKMLDPEAAPISGDPNRLQQVVWNLLSNAIKFTSRGGKVQVLLMRVNSHIEITVADTGIGINPAFLDHVFERFRQEEASINRKFGGLGLGLSIVKHLVELHGGSVSVESSGEGCGSTFSVRLPLMAAHQRRYEEPRVHPGTSELDSPDFRTVDLAGIKVLVVDDEIDARDLIYRVLSDCHAEVLLAGSARDALRLIEIERPDVLVSDIGMPDVDGYELLKQVRALGKLRGGRMPAIALTAFARTEDRTRALRAGFLVHVAKPVEPSELVATIANVAGRSCEPVE
jgi:PAS domain S-box-containing protein